MLTYRTRHEPTTAFSPVSLDPFAQLPGQHLRREEDNAAILHLAKDGITIKETVRRHRMPNEFGELTKELKRLQDGRPANYLRVKYRSVKNGGGICVVLFADNTDVDPIMDLAQAPDGDRLLKMRRVVHKNG